MDGLQATAAIRNARYQWKHIPIVAMTAHAMSGYKEPCLQAGIDDHISKSLHVDELFAIVEHFSAPNGIPYQPASVIER
jgi:CheY-like chemotaxis protein